MRALKRPFATFLTVEDAELIIAQSSEDDNNPTVKPRAEVGPSLWRTSLLSGISISVSLTWLAIGSYRLYEYLHHHKRSHLSDIVVPFVVAVTWLYAGLRPIVRPTVTPPFDLFTLFLVYWTASSVDIFLYFYDHYTQDKTVVVGLPFGGMIANWVAITALLVVVLGMPLGIPSARVLEIQKVSILRMVVL